MLDLLFSIYLHSTDKAEFTDVKANELLCHDSVCAEQEQLKLPEGLNYNYHLT